VQIDETVRKKDVFVIQPCTAPVNDHLVDEPERPALREEGGDRHQPQGSSRILGPHQFAYL
jgi:hypothetical protein